MSEHFIAGLSTVTYGIRDGRSISVDEFMNTFLAFPAVEEVVPEKLRTLERGRPWRDSQFASTRLSPSRDMSR